MPERLRLAIQLLLWVGPRNGEVGALQRGDPMLSGENPGLLVRRNVT